MSILKEGDVDKAVKTTKKVLKKIKSGKIDNKELIIHTKVTKNLEDYKQTAPHVTAARKIEQHGIKISKGDMTCISRPKLHVNT